MARMKSNPQTRRKRPDDKSIAGFLVVFFSGLVATAPLFLSYEPFFLHDVIFHFGRISSLANGIEQGIFPVKLYSAQAFGFGYVDGRADARPYAVNPAC